MALSPNDPNTSSTPGESQEKGSLFYGESHDQLIQGHRYDGIKEYDNPMPGWWVWLFWATGVFAVVYVVGITFGGFIDTYEEDLAQSQAELAEIRQAYLEANPVFQADAASLAEAIENEMMAEAGAQHYASYCAACHGDAGQGVIGPNLADNYWVHGGTPVDVYNVITNGVIEKGMAAWQGALTPEERAELVAYIYADLQGTDPAGAKAPEGELVE